MKSEKAKSLIVYAYPIYDFSGATSQKDFDDDFARLAYVTRLMIRILKKKTATWALIQLLKNHVTTLMNVFGQEPGIRLLYSYLDPIHWPFLKALLESIGNRVTSVTKIDGTAVDVAAIEITADIAAYLSVTEPVRKQRLNKRTDETV